ncbi:type VI secretion system baseplate subunit TssG [Mucilaginibacter jinjuensis]|uniref:Type VI secretion system baseplate subunit TssG n=1 Tax=Mucilaginibacter jinjuensis TaxID=1176721 RepID=A0ABY7T420_9SPHI|nr:type VI secretion system baseplate subunit TssG [Mucilaginibacter jinjuensis]WCT10476.1 type VI secretion system baseplate subunit TssG [Mucilaginibacter jinjuensis]
MIVKQPNQLDTDFKAVTLAAELIERGVVNADEVIILPVGAKQRAYAKEIASVTNYESVYRNRKMLSVNINREGLYDMLPEGLFHLPPSSSVMITEEEMVKDVVARREEEKQARAFFAPFEAELYHIRTIVELYESRLDKKSEYDELVNIFLKEWREFKCFTNQQMVILMHVLPVIHEQRNNLPFISNVLSIMFNANISLQYQFNDSKPLPASAKALETKLGSGVLGVNFIAGLVNEPEEELTITIGPLSAKQMLTFLPGTRSAEALDVLLSYFIPLQTGIITKFIAEPEYQKLVLGFGEENACLGFTTFLGN